MSFGRSEKAQIAQDCPSGISTSSGSPEQASLKPTALTAPRCNESRKVGEM